MHYTRVRIFSQTYLPAAQTERSKTDVGLWHTVKLTTSSAVAVSFGTANNSSFESILSVREAMFMLDQNIWRSNITLKTKLLLYNTCILPIFLYGAETWSVTATSSKKIDTLDNWCLRCILSIHWTELITNDEVCYRTEQPFLSDTVRRRRLSFCGHLNCADHWQDHYRVLQACIMGTLWSGDGGPADPDRPGWERWKPTCDQWTLAWHQPNDVHRTERHGDNSWQRLRLRQAPETTNYRH